MEVFGGAPGLLRCASGRAPCTAVHRDWRGAAGRVASRLALRGASVLRCRFRLTPRIHLESTGRIGDVVELPERQSRHVQVLRLQPGDAVDLFDGVGGDWHASVLTMARRSVDVRIDAAATGPSRELERRVTLALGVPANDRMDALVEKATELGVAAIQPLLCERSVLRLKGERGDAKRRHWHAIAIAASEQCGRRLVPAVSVQSPMAEWLASLPASSADTRSVRWLLSLDHAAIPVTDRLASMSADAAVLVLSGPEGGLTADEEAEALRHGFERVSLGTRVLRADTAPVALLAWLGIASASQWADVDADADSSENTDAVKNSYADKNAYADKNLDAAQAQTPPAASEKLPGPCL